MRDAEFTEFAGTATPRLLRLGWLLTGDRQQAQDLVQSALMRTYISWQRIRNDDAKAYTRKILVNLHTDWLRRRFWLERSVPELPHDPDGGDRVGRVEARMALIAALQSLSRRERSVGGAALLPGSVRGRNSRNARCQRWHRQIYRLPRVAQTA